MSIEEELLAAVKAAVACDEAAHADEYRLRDRIVALSLGPRRDLVVRYDTGAEVPAVSPDPEALDEVKQAALRKVVIDGFDLDCWLVRDRLSLAWRRCGRIGPDWAGLARLLPDRACRWLVDWLF